MLQHLILCVFLAINTIYSYTVPSLNGGSINFNDFEGKKILLVNVASHSKYSYQLRQLDSLQQRCEDSLVVVVVPSNSFNNEPMEATELQLVMKNYHFKVAAKAKVRGDDKIEVYKWITDEQLNGRFSTEIRGDFQKYLVDENGNLLAVFSSIVNPLKIELSGKLNTLD